MLKKITKWMMTGMVIAAAAGFGCIGMSAAETEEMDPYDLIYIPSDMCWENDGNKLVVEGEFYNLSDEYDIVEIEEAEIYLADDSANIIKTVTVNTDYFKEISHSGSFEYNFTCKIQGGSEAYGENGLIPIVGATFNYAECEGTGCRYCGGSKSGKTKGSEKSETCTECDGSGRSEFKCVNCDGTGKDPFYETTRGSVIHGFVDEECPLCDGTGYKRCYFCGGTGKE